MVFGVQYSPLFQRQYKKLPEKLKTAVKDRISIMRENPHNAILKTHKLAGPLEGFLGCSVTHSCRIIFEIEESVIKLYEVGEHDIYD